MDIAEATGQLDYHLAFALGGIEGCKPMWGAEFQIDDPIIMEPIKAVQGLGGKMIIATGKRTQVIGALTIICTEKVLIERDIESESERSIGKNSLVCELAQFFTQWRQYHL